MKIAEVEERCQGVLTALSEIVVGKEHVLRQVMAGILANGHILIEDYPGLAKTLIARLFSQALELRFSRIQFTPDLLPGDITGSSIYDQREGRFEFRRGPIFAHLLLADEINRATPKTQSALLEAMQERQVTIEGQSYPLEPPFLVIATQNPIELEGTYPLPEAQLDRFALKLLVAYPRAESLTQMIEVALDAEPAAQLAAVVDPARAAALVAGAREVLIASPLRESAVRLVLATQPASAQASAVAQQHFRYGASPRGLQALLRAARVHALLEGRVHVAVEDLHAVALPALRHRVLLNVDSELDGHTTDSLLTRVVAECLG